MWATANECLLLSTVMHDAVPSAQHAAAPDDVQAAPAMSASCLLHIFAGPVHQSGQQLAGMQCLTAQPEPLADGVRYH